MSRHDFSGNQADVHAALQHALVRRCDYFADLVDVVDAAARGAVELVDVDFDVPFGALGGNPLAAAAVLAAVREQTGVQLPSNALVADVALRDVISAFTPPSTDRIAAVARRAADDALSADLVACVLERLSTPRPEQTLAGLEALYRAWCQRVPYDNVLRVVQIGEHGGDDPPGIPARRFFADWLGLGCGGECVATSLAWRALLRALGFNATCVVGALAGTTPNHITVIVQHNDEDFVVDTVNLCGTPVPLRDGAVSGQSPAHEVTVSAIAGTWALSHLTAARRARQRCTLLHLDPSPELIALLYTVTQASSTFVSFNLRPYARCNAFGGGIVCVAGDTVTRTAPDGSIQVERAATPFDALAASGIGYAPSLVDRVRAATSCAA